MSNPRRQSFAFGRSRTSHPDDQQSQPHNAHPSFGDSFQSQGNFDKFSEVSNDEGEGVSSEDLFGPGASRAKQEQQHQQQLRDQAALDFLKCLPDGCNPVDFLQNQLIRLSVPTTAFSKIKPLAAGGRVVSTALPVCHYPATREAVCTLIGPETENGTFPQSFLSSALTTRLGVTVSTNVPEQFLSSSNTKDVIDADSFRAKIETKGGLNATFASMRVRAARKQAGIKSNSGFWKQQEASNASFRFGSMMGDPATGSGGNKNSFRMDRDDDDDDGNDGDGGRGENEDEDSDDNRDIDKRDIGADVERVEHDQEMKETAARAAAAGHNHHHHHHHHDRNNSISDDTRKNKKTDLSNVSMKNLPSGSELEEFPDVLRDGIRSAAIEVMQRYLGPRMSFLITRQRRLAVMGQEVDFGNPAASPVSMICKTHSLGQVHQMAADAIRKGCAALQFALPQASVMFGSSSASPAVSPALVSPTTTTFNTAASSHHNSKSHEKFPMGLQFPTLSELGASSQHILGAGGAGAGGGGSGSSSSATSGGGHNNSQNNNHITGVTAPSASFFANWSLDAIHSMIHNGFVQVVPPKTQLCYQGCAVATRQGSDTPCIIVILSGSIEATVQGVMPCADASHWGPPTTNSSKKSTDAEAASNLMMMHQAGTSSDAQGDDQQQGGPPALLTRRGSIMTSPQLQQRGGFQSSSASPTTSKRGGIGGEETEASLLEKRKQTWDNFYRSRAIVHALEEGENQQATSSSSTSTSSSSFASANSLAQAVRAGGINVTPILRDPAHSVSAILAANFSSSSSPQGSPLSAIRSSSSSTLVSPTSTLAAAGSPVSFASASSSSAFQQRRQQQLQRRKNILRAELFPVTAIGPFGISPTGSRTEAMPYPVSLRTKKRSELFLIPYSAVMDAIEKNVTASSSSSVGVMSDAEHSLVATACHQFALSYFATCGQRFLRKVSWLLTNVSPQLRDAACSAFRPILLSDEKLSSFKSSMAMGNSRDEQHSGSGGGGVSSSSVAAAAASAGGGAGGSFVNDPVAFLIVPLAGSKAKVQLIEAAHKAEPSVVSVDVLVSEYSAAHSRLGSAQNVQKTLREGDGLEISSSSSLAKQEGAVGSSTDEEESFAFGLREVFVTAGRRLASAGALRSDEENSASSSKHSPAAGGSGDASDQHGKSPSVDGGDNNSSSSAELSHVGTFISVSKVLLDEHKQQHERKFPHHQQHPTSFTSSLSASVSPAGSMSLLRRGTSSKHVKPVSSSAEASSASPSSSFSKQQQQQQTTSTKKSASTAVADSYLPVTGFVLCFTMSAAELQQRIAHFLRDNPDKKQEAAALFAEADAKLVQYRTSAMSSGTQHSSGGGGGGGGGAASHHHDQHRRKSIVGGKKHEPAEAHKVPTKTVHELLSTALDRFPVVGPACRLLQRHDILEIFSLLFEFKKYRPNTIILSKTEKAADRVVVVLKGRVALLGGSTFPEHDQVLAHKEKMQHLMTMKMSNNTNNNNGQQRRRDHFSSSGAAAAVPPPPANPPSNTQYWRPLTFAGVTSILPHKWDRAAVAISEVTTAEASRALVLPFLKDTRLFDAVKTLAEVVLTYPGVCNVSNWQEPEVVTTAMKCFSGQPWIHPVLPRVDATAFNPRGVQRVGSESVPRLPYFGSRGEDETMQQHLDQRAALAAVFQDVVEQSKKHGDDNDDEDDVSSSGDDGVDSDDNRPRVFLGVGQNSNDKRSEKKTHNKKKKRNATRTAEEITAISRPFRPYPTADAAALLRESHITLNRDFFLVDSVDPISPQQTRQAGDRVQRGASSKKMSPQRKSTSSPSSTNRVSPPRANITRGTVSATANFAAAPSSSSAGSRAVDIARTHRSLSSGLWMRKRPSSKGS